jgi:MarR family transcriptional regulator, organic hydroperoxide resistance regulator
MTCLQMQESLGFVLAQVCKAHRAAVDVALRAQDLHVGQEMILTRLWEQDGQTQSQLAETMCVEPPTVTRMIQRMEQEQNPMLLRRPDAEDARVQRVFLTERGIAIRSEVEACWGVVENQLIQGLTQEERMLLRRLLLQLRDNLG